MRIGFRFDLNSLAKDYLQESKSEAQLYEAAKMWGLDPKSEMWKLPASHVGEYAEQDAAVTLRLWHYLQIEKLQKQNLINIFELETDLFPVLFADETQRRCKVDLDKAEVIKNDLQNKKINSWDPLKNFLEWMSKSGLPLAWQRRSIVFHCHMIVLQQDNQSLTRTFLRHMIPLLLKWLWKRREINKARTTFIESITKHSYRGRIHAEIHQMRSDQGGTVTGRFSYSNPNLQQIPARHAIFGPLISYCLFLKKIVSGVSLITRNKNHGSWSITQALKTFLWCRQVC